MRMPTRASLSALAALLTGFAGVAYAAPARKTADPFKLKPGASGKVCLDCHSGEMDPILKKPFVHTPVRARECVGCHSPHASMHGKLLAAERGNMCASCHSVAPDLPKSTHKPVENGGCLTCHDAHASAFKYNLVKAANDLCADCHKPVVDAAVKAKHPHKPVQQSCAACHDPHGSGKSDSLLRAAVPELCVGCHKVDKPAFLQKHVNYPVGKSRCTSCHDPHGSNVRGMLYDVVHSPVAKAMCAQCHNPASAPNRFETKQTGAALCRGCHAEAVNGMLGQTRVHWALLGPQACLSCHSPHAGKQKGLLRGDMAAVCGGCHGDTLRRQQAAETKHKPVAEGQCTKCHSPHGSSSALMLTKPDVTEVCASCHDWQKHSTHPIGDQYKDPRNPNLSVGCLSCHRAHGTEYKHMNPYMTTTDLCTKCHEKFKR